MPSALCHILSLSSISVLSSALFKLSYFEFETESDKEIYYQLILIFLGLLFGLLATQKAFRIDRSSLLVVSQIFYISVTFLKLCQYLLSIEEVLMLCINNLALTLGLILSSYTCISHLGFYFPSQFHALFPMILTSVYLGTLIGEVLCSFLKFYYLPFVFVPLLVLVLVFNSILYVFSNIDSESVSFARINIFKYLRENVTSKQDEKKKILCFVLLVSSQLVQVLMLDVGRNLVVISLDFAFFTIGGLASVLPLKTYKFYYTVLFVTYGLTSACLVFRPVFLGFLLARFVNISVFSILVATLFCDMTSCRTLNLNDECSSCCKSSLFVFLSSFSCLLAILFLELPKSLLSSPIFNLSASLWVLLTTVWLSLPSTNKGSNPNITETEPAEAINQHSSHFEKSIPDDSSDSIKIQEVKNDEKRLEMIEKSLQDLEYHCLGIFCGYFPDEIVKNSLNVEESKSKVFHSRKFKSFGEAIDEQVGEESDNSGLDSKNSSAKRERRKSEGSKSSESSVNASLDEKTVRVSDSFKDSCKTEVFRRSIENLNRSVSNSSS